MPHPFHMTVPFTVPGDPEDFLTLYLQSSSGGLYDNDKHELNVDLSKKSNFHLTTQASTIVHEAKRNKGCKQDLTFKIKEDSYLEYLPDPIILWLGANLVQLMWKLRKMHEQYFVIAMSFMIREIMNFS